ncbi:DoxX family protein [Polaribacter sp. Z014]|uniref:DoxX family protein n=1 Tax=unclassified Polaribacter TaxID=196858 RepID=UPI00193B6E03|nr:MULTISPECIES: DoxX family protein [unclassified Polaribacter]MCL7762040.1 DoxX family protein [Polaribacter sp. Z014]QVY64528.1 DoxX family protein [Polaribacter sp. Q13]
MRFLSEYPTEVLILLFLIITYLISAFEKISDWKGSVNYIESHFKNSPLKNKVSFLLTILFITEIIASILMIIGVYQIYIFQIKEIALLGIELSAVSIIFMLIGQRLAKDYPGAMSLGVYFIITLCGVYLLNK